MAGGMTVIDWQRYGQLYGVTQERKSAPILELSLEELAGPEGAEALVRTYAPQIKASTYDVPATYFSSVAGRFAAAYCFALWHDGIDPGWTLQDAVLQMWREKEYAEWSFVVNQFGREPLPQEAAVLETAILSALERFLGQVTRPMVDTVAEAGGVSAGSMWALMATGLHYMLGMWEGLVRNEEDKARLDIVSDVLLHRLQPEVFGRTRNPFAVKRRMVDNIKADGGKVAIKGSCCLAYKTEHARYCFTCPKISEEERQAKREEAAAQNV